MDHAPGRRRAELSQHVTPARGAWDPRAALGGRGAPARRRQARPGRGPGAMRAAFRSGCARRRARMRRACSQPRRAPRDMSARAGGRAVTARPAAQSRQRLRRRPSWPPPIAVRRPVARAARKASGGFPRAPRKACRRSGILPRAPRPAGMPRSERIAPRTEAARAICGRRARRRRSRRFPSAPSGATGRRRNRSTPAAFPDRVGQSPGPVGAMALREEPEARAAPISAEFGPVAAMARRAGLFRRDRP